MNKELQILEGPDCTLILSALRNLPGRTEEYPWQPAVRTDGLRAEIRTWDLPNTQQEGYYDDCDVRVESLCERRKLKERKKGRIQEGSKQDFMLW